MVIPLFCYSLLVALEPFCGGTFSGTLRKRSLIGCGAWRPGKTFRSISNQQASVDRDSKCHQETSLCNNKNSILTQHEALLGATLEHVSLSLKRQEAHHHHHHSIPRRHQLQQDQTLPAFTVVDQQSRQFRPIHAGSAVDLPQSNKSSSSQHQQQQQHHHQRYQYLEGTVLLETSLPVLCTAASGSPFLRAPSSSSSSGIAGTLPIRHQGAINGGALVYRKPVYFEADGVGTCEEPPSVLAAVTLSSAPVPAANRGLDGIHGSPGKHQQTSKRRSTGGVHQEQCFRTTAGIELQQQASNNQHCGGPNRVTFNTEGSSPSLLNADGISPTTGVIEEQQLFWGIPTPPGPPDPGDTAYYLQQRKSWSAQSRSKSPHHHPTRGGGLQDETPTSTPSSSAAEAMEPKHWLALVFVLFCALFVGLSIGVPLALRDTGNLRERLLKVEQLLREVPLIDGHNDLAWNIRQFKQNQLRKVNFSTDLSRDAPPWSTSPWSQTDFVRLRKGHVGAQFWSAYAPCGSQDLNAVQITLEQIDVIKRFIQKNPRYLKLVHASHGILEAQREGLIASLIGVEGGHSLGNSLGVLRMLHDLGTKYLSLTHSCDTPWAEADGPKHRSSTATTSLSLMKKKVVGLTDFGRRVIREMNRLGMMVDLSHSSTTTMQQALEESSAPVIFTHSGAQAVCNNSRNVPDYILRLLASKDGIIMVPFYPPFISCSSNASISDVIRHMNHIRDVIGVDFIGIGSDFDGIDNLPKGLEDVSKYPYLLAELLADPRWSDEDIKKVAGLNFLRVMGKVEKVSEDLQRAGLEPEEHPIPPGDLKGHLNCTFIVNG